MTLEIKVAILELFPTTTHKLLHPGAENAKSCLSTTTTENNGISFRTKLVSGDNIREVGFLNSFDVIIIPGGSSGHQARNVSSEYTFSTLLSNLV
jgi:hypothetical protein